MSESLFESTDSVRSIKPLRYAQSLELEGPFRFDPFQGLRGQRSRDGDGFQHHRRSQDGPSYKHHRQCAGAGLHAAAAADAPARTVRAGTRYGSDAASQGEQLGGSIAAPNIED